MRFAAAALVTLALGFTACASPPAPDDASALDATSDVVSPLDSPGSDTPDTSAPDAVDAACVPAMYPPGPYDFALPAVLPDLAFTAADGSAVHLHDYYAPCDARAPLLVLRVMAAWSGPARWNAAHTAVLRALPDAGRVVVVDLLALGEDNAPATAADLARWRAQYDVMPDALLLDPGEQLQTMFFGDNRLPLYVLVDTRTMIARQSLPAPESDTLGWEISTAVARSDGTTPPARPPRDLYDGRLSPDQWDMVRAMTAPGAPPPDPSNGHADDPAAASLGSALFGDTGLSPSGSFSCAGCHKPDGNFVDGLPTGVAAATGSRNTPTVVYAAHSRWQFWDGRADSLWSQALGPIENPAEMASSRLFVAHEIAANHAADYTAVFGALPDLSDAARFPAAGRPGDPAWEAMSVADQETVNRVFANAGKAIEAYERTLTLGATPLDAYAAGNVDVLTPRARDGLQRWFRFGCAQCHYGSRLTDDSFHNIHMPTGRADGVADRGRIDAIDLLISSAFTMDGPFSDDAASPARLAGLAPLDGMLGQFKTPTLRGAAATGPWGHGGTFDTLENVALHYSRVDMHPTVAGTTGTEDIHLDGFHEDPTILGSLADVIRAATPN